MAADDRDDFAVSTSDSDIIHGRVGAILWLANSKEINRMQHLAVEQSRLQGRALAFPDLELGAAYDKAMRTLVFEPLGMTSTTFDYARPLAGNHAFPHSPDIDGKTSVAAMDLNYSIIPVRPAGSRVEQCA